MDHRDDWQRLLHDQHGVVTCAQLLARGFTDNGIRAQVAAGRWLPLHHGVYVTHSGPLTPEAKRIGALLACRVALLSHETAGEVHGFVEPDPDRPIHVTVRYGCSPARRDGITVHRSRAFAHIGVEGANPPVTSRVHTILDLAVAAPDAEEAMRLAHQLALDAGVHGLALQRAVELRRPLRHRRALEDAATLLREGVLSALEHRYLMDVERSHGLPHGHRQEPVSVDGVERYEDVAYDLPGGRVIVRLDGFGYHRDQVTALIDRRRVVAAAIAAATSIPFGWTEVSKLPCRTAREIGAVLRSLGWKGSLVTCPRCM